MDEKVQVLIIQFFRDPVDCYAPGSSVHGILQEYWRRVAIPCSRESSWPKDQTQVSCIAGGFFTIIPDMNNGQGS